MVPGGLAGADLERLGDLELDLLPELDALVEDDLAAEEVKGLDSGGSLVQGGDLGVTVDLRGKGLAKRVC